MPWTLVPHAAIAVDPEVTYARARLGDDRLILAETLVERVLGEDAEIEERMPGSALLGLRYEPPFPYITDYGEQRPHGAGGRLRVDRGRHRRGPHRRGLRRGRLPARHRQRPDHPQPGPAGRHVRRAHRPVLGDARARCGRARRRGPARVRPPVPRGRVRALVPALLALRHAAHLLREEELVRAHHGGQGRAAGRERDDQLVPRPHQARALRQVAREQRGLGALAGALLGHAAAGLALRARGTTSAWARSTRSPSAAASGPTTCTGPTSTTWCSPARSAAGRCAACRT